MAGRKLKPTALKKLEGNPGKRKLDTAAFAAYCQSYARWKEAQEHISSEGSTFETDKGYQQQTSYKGLWKVSFILREF